MHLHPFALVLTPPSHTLVHTHTHIHITHHTSRIAHTFVCTSFSHTHSIVVACLRLDNAHFSFTQVNQARQYQAWRKKVKRAHGRRDVRLVDVAVWLYLLVCVCVFVLVLLPPFSLLLLLLRLFSLHSVPHVYTGASLTLSLCVCC
jgi:hypothetical protein